VRTRARAVGRKKREGGFLKERGRRGSHGTHTAWCGAPADDPQALRDKINKFIEKIIF
jgi:hypothetical protein